MLLEMSYSYPRRQQDCFGETDQFARPKRTPIGLVGWVTPACTVVPHMMLVSRIRQTVNFPYELMGILTVVRQLSDFLIRGSY